MKASTLVAMLAVGAIFGSIISKYLVVIGRRFMLMIVTFVYMTAILLMFIQSFFSLAAGRFIQGLCDGCFTFLIPVYSTILLINSIKNKLGNYLLQRRVDF